MTMINEHLNSLRGADYMSTMFNVITAHYKMFVVVSLILIVLSRIVSAWRKLSLQARDAQNSVEKLQLSLKDADDRIARMTSANRLLRRSLDLLREKNRKNLEKLAEYEASAESQAQAQVDKPSPPYNKDDVEAGICMAISALSNTRSVYAKDAVEILRNILGKFEEETPSPQVARRKRRRSPTPVKFYFTYSSDSESD